MLFVCASIVVQLVYPCVYTKTALIQHWDRNGAVKQINHGPHEECGENRTDTNKGGDLLCISTAEEKHADSKDNADGIRTDSHTLEFAQFPLVRTYQCDYIICGNA